MGHALAIVAADDHTAEMWPHCVYKDDGTEGDGEFDWAEVGGRFGKPLRLLHPRPRRGVFALFGKQTHVAQARRSAVDLDGLRERFPVSVVSAGQWMEPDPFEEAREIIAAIPGDPLLTAVDCHL